MLIFAGIFAEYPLIDRKGLGMQRTVIERQK